MPESIITFFGRQAKVACDGNCQKAWGVNNRPKIHLSDDIDDYAYLADGELGQAPSDPGTYEGGDAKPSSAVCFPNRWCIRECERCEASKPDQIDQPLVLKNFNVRIYNQPSKHLEDE